MKNSCAICEVSIDDEVTPVCLCDECLRQIDCCFGDREKFTPEEKEELKTELPKAIKQTKSTKSVKKGKKKRGTKRNDTRTKR